MSDNVVTPTAATTTTFTRTTRAITRATLFLGTLLLVLVAAIPAAGHETDQYTLPPERRFADMGPYLTRWFYDAVAKGADVQNARIRSALNSHAKPADIQKLQSADDIAATVNAQFPIALFFIEGLDKTMISSATAVRYPGSVVG